MRFLGAGQRKRREGGGGGRGGGESHSPSASSMVRIRNRAFYRAINKARAQETNAIFVAASRSSGIVLLPGRHTSPLQYVSQIHATRIPLTFVTTDVNKNVSLSLSKNLFLLKSLNSFLLSHPLYGT